MHVMNMSCQFFVTNNGDEFDLMICWSMEFECNKVLHKTPRPDCMGLVCEAKSQNHSPFISVSLVLATVCRHLLPVTEELLPPPSSVMFDASGRSISKQ